MRKKCELCGGVARMYCESDQASLCWDCDEKVHGANFLVAKHTRCLLCSACQSLTPWKATGPRLGHTISACNSCASVQNSSNNNLQQRQFESQSQETNGHDYDEHLYDEDDDDEESYEDDDYDEEEEYGEDEDEDAENQVVPWAANRAAAEQAPPPPTAGVSSSSSISSGEELFSRGRGGSVMKRMRGNSDNLFSDETNRG